MRDTTRAYRTRHGAVPMLRGGSKAVHVPIYTQSRPRIDPGGWLFRSIIDPWIESWVDASRLSRKEGSYRRP